MTPREGDYVFLSTSSYAQRKIASFLKQILVLSPEIQGARSYLHLQTSISAIAQHLVTKIHVASLTRIARKLIEQALS